MKPRLSWPRWLSWMKGRVGRRGTFLLFLAMLDSVIAYSLLAMPVYSYPLLINHANVIRQLYPIMPPDAWAGAWLGTACLCAAGAFAKVDRIPYSVAALVKTGWAFRYAYLWLTGVPGAWIFTTIWLFFSITVVMISGWPEASPLVVIVVPDNGQQEDHGD